MSTCRQYNLCWLYSVLISLIMNTGIVLAQAPEFTWAIRAGGNGYDQANAVAIDQMGNTIVVGYFDSSATFGNVNLVGLVNYNTFVAKYSNSGELIWVRQVKQTDGMAITGMALGAGGYTITTDCNNNIIIAGGYQGKAECGSEECTSAGKSDIFIAKFEPNGDLEWLKSLGGPNEDYARGVAVDLAGNIIFTGQFEKMINIGSTLLSAIGVLDIFIAKFDAYGDIKWVRQAGGMYYIDVGNIAVDHENNCLVVGQYNNRALLDDITLEATGGTYDVDVFIAKYDNSGKLLWAKSAGGFGFEWGAGIATDLLGNSLITGYFESSTNFGKHLLNSTGGRDIYVAKYSPSGEAIWAISAGGKSDDMASCITVYENGSCAIIGSFQDAVSFSGINLTSTASNIFIAKYDVLGNIQWVKCTNNISPNGITVNGIALDKKGHGIIVGTFYLNAKFGELALFSQSYDIFITSLLEHSGKLIWPISGAFWAMDSTETIEWNSSQIKGNAEIEISIDGGYSWSSIAKDIVNSGSFRWTPSLMHVSDRCRIKIISSSNPGSYLQSDDDFSILTRGDINFDRIIDEKDIDVFGQLVDSGAPSPRQLFSLDFNENGEMNLSDYLALDSIILKIGQPEPSVKWMVGSTDTITWKNSQAFHENVKIELSLDAGKTWSILSSSTPDSGWYIWAPLNKSISDSCKLKITKVNRPYITCTSNGYFRISDTAPRIIWPAGGEFWAMDSLETIRWNPVGIAGDVCIDISTNGGSSWSRIASDIPNIGRFQWIPDFHYLSDYCRIRLSSSADPSRFIQSELDFTILIMGDVNFDNFLNKSDWRMVLDIILGRIEMTSKRFFAADVNKNGGINIFDLTAVMNKILWIESPADSSVWRSGVSDTIHWWCYSKYPENVSIELSTDASKSWKALCLSIPDSGFFVWTPTYIDISDSCKIRITKLGRPYLTSVNEGYFAIDSTVGFVGARGDINFDEKIDVRDVILCLRIIVGGLLLPPIPPGHLTPTANELWAADFNQDNVINSGDALQILFKSLDNNFIASLACQDPEMLMPLTGNMGNDGVGEYLFPIAINCDAVYAADLQLSYDPDHYSFISISPAISSSLYALNTQKRGVLVVSLINTTGITNRDGQIALIRFNTINLKPGNGIQVDRAAFFDKQSKAVSAMVLTSVSQKPALPETYCLYQNFPNPFNPVTKIKFDLPRGAHVTLEVANIQGQRVRLLKSAYCGAGIYEAIWDGKDDDDRPIPSGVYFYSLYIDAGAFSAKKKMLLVK